jgi:rubrerythrin
MAETPSRNGTVTTCANCGTAFTPTGPKPCPACDAPLAVTELGGGGQDV